MSILDMVWILCIYQARSVFSQTVGCSSGPCQNEAVCQETDTGFQCFCVNGFAGEVCEINFDDCSSAPCRNNATCIDHVASYACVCAEGFIGQDCQSNIDECESSPCLRNGTCIDLVDGFICECISPFTGHDCSQLPCNTEPCENGADCRNDLDFNESVSGFVCDCNKGFSGPRCEINLDDCDPDNVTSCSGNGLCVDGINDYSCLCEPGWVGDDCESPVDDCIGNSCKNNATCLDEHQGYVCTCEPGYEGSLCEREKDECSEWQPCKNGAVCVDLFNDYRCECANGWFGVNCTEEVNECETNQCQNGAQCIDVIGGFQCRCPPFYTGLLCETLYNPCAPGYNPCQNEANCIVPPDGKYRCFCAAGFTGVHCEVNVNECLSFPCRNNATCEDIVAGYICHCAPGWEGKNCQTSIDECASVPCLHGADCLDLHIGFECNCTREYHGLICDEVVDFCLSQPCEHDGTCLSLVGGYKCVCLPPYTGQKCLDLIDSCQSDPCVNNGTCMNTESGFICVCLVPFTGKTCNERVDFCESEPCFLGTCVSLNNDYICVCPEYITGKQCTDLVDYCGDSPCKNEGNCINGEFDFRCVCAYGFTGRTCIEMIDFCVEEPCQNDANCTNIPGGFMCICPFEFTGDLCQTKLPTVTFSSVSYTSSLISEISSDKTIISSSIRSTASSGTESVISSTASQYTKSFTINQLMSFTSSSLQSLVTSNVSVYSSSSTVATPLSFSVTPSSVQKSKFLRPSVTFTPSKYITSSIEARSDLRTVDSVTRKPTSTITAAYSSTITPVYSSTITPVYSSTITPVYSSTITPVYSSTITPVYSSTIAPVYSSTITPVYSSTIAPAYSSTITPVYSSTIAPVYSSTITPVYSSIRNSTHLSPSKNLITSESTLPSLISSVLPVVTVDIVKSTSHTSFFVPSTVTSLIVKDSKLISSSSKELSLVSEEPKMSITSIHGLRTTLPLSTDSLFLKTDISESRYFSGSRTLVSSVSEIAQRSILLSSSVKTSNTYQNKSDASIISSLATLSYLKHISSFEVSASTVFPTSSLSTSMSSSFKVSAGTYMTLTVTDTSEFSSSFSYLFTEQSSSLPITLQTSFTIVSLLTTFTDASTSSYSFHSFEELIFKTITSMSISSGDYTSSFYRTTSPPFSSKGDSSVRVITYSMFSSITRGFMYSTGSVINSYSAIQSSTRTFVSTDTSSSTASELIMLSTAVYSSMSSYISSPTSTASREIESVTKSLTSFTFLTTAAESTFLTTDIGPSFLTDEYSVPVSFKTNSVSVSDPKPFSTVELTDMVSLTEKYSLQSIASKLFSSDQTDVLRTSSYAFVEYTSSLHLRSTITYSTPDSSTILDFTDTSALNSYSETQSKEKSSLHTSFDIILSTSPSSQISPTSSRQYITSESLPLEPSEFLTSSSEPLESLTLSYKALDSFTTHTATSLESVNTKTADFVFSSEVNSFSTEVISRKVGSSLSSVREELSSSFGTFTESINPTKVMSGEEMRTTVTVTYSKKISRQTDIATTNKTVPFTDFITLVTTVQSPFSNQLVLSTTLSVSSTTAFVSSTMTSSLTTSLVSTTTPGSVRTCDNIVCHNSGICREDVSGPYCDCGEKYIGPQCKTESTACEGYICENGGVCVMTLTLYNVQVPTCSCPLPFVGSLCQSEKLIYYPTFTGSSYLEFGPPNFSPDQSNEIYISVKTTQRDSTIMYSANQDVGYKQAAFIYLYLTNGNLRYSFSCDGEMTGTVQTDMKINTGDVYEILIRQVWSAGPGEWCTAAVIINSRTFVSGPLLTIKQSHTLGNLYIGGKPRFTYKGNQVSDIFIMDGYIGCVHNFQINKHEIDLVSMAIKGINIENCNVPVCQQNPCKNGATCHSSGEEWFCSCPPGYGGSLCEQKLCGVNPCQHGGTCVILEKEQDQLCLCPYGRGGVFCDQEQSVTLPHFVGNQYGYSSYIAYEQPHYVENDFEMEFTMILDNGSADSSLILFLGNRGSYEGRRDFMAVGIDKGYVVFRFDLGSGSGQIYSAEELDMSLPQHYVRFGRSGYMGWIRTDNQRNVTGRSPGVLTALNTNSKLYVGNIERGEIGILPNGAEFQDGFRGCIYNFKIKSHITDFLSPGSPPGHVISGRNIGQCSSLSCDQNSCQNGAECRDLGASIHCICVEGWKGTFCTDIISVCDTMHACSSGSSCVPIIPDSYFCLCPLGKRGTYCGEEFIISDPLFLGEGSYMSFESVYIKKQTDIKIQVKPVGRDGLLFYVAQRLHSHSGDFLSLTMNKGTVEMRVDMGTSVNIIRSKVLIDTGGWYTVEAGRNATHGYISVDGDTISTQLTGLMTFLDTTSHFYIGGLPNLNDASPEAFENEPVPFQGCIRELVVNGKRFQLDQNGAKDGRNIEDCDGTSCGYYVCQNEGICMLGMNDTFTCSCTQSFVGRRCDTPMACSDHLCLNGECRATGPDTHECDCHLGWTGETCDRSIVIGTSVDLKTESFIYLIDDSFLKSNKSNTNIAFVFKSTSLNGVILWNGQTYSDDEDYLGVGIQDGRFKLVWNLGWYSKGEILSSLKLNNGDWHTIIIKREKQILALEIDGITYESRVSGDFFNLDTFGHYFIGSFKDGRVKDMTLGYFTEPFNGCLKDLLIDDEDYVDFDTVDEGLNVAPCIHD